MNRYALLWLSVVAVACSDPAPSTDGGGSGASDSQTPATTAGPGPGSNSTTNQPDGSGGGGEGPGTTSGSTTTDDPSADETAGSPVIFDYGGIPDAPEYCQQGEGEVEFSYIWIANSTQGTISKINTETLVEEGRYQTRPDTNGSPSRTSVSLTGNVAVANRNGGLTKFYALEDNCVDSNNNGTINTSSGAADILPWGNEECMAWHTPMTYTSQRPVAWTQGEWDQAACATLNEKVWTSGANGESIEVLLVDGDTGIIEETVPIPGVSAGFFGIYGAAVDSEGNFWGSQLSLGSVVRVDRQTMDVQVWPMVASGYGMTVDQEGYVWTCSNTAARFDPVTQTWQTANVGGSGGCMSDGGDILWMASSPMVGINRHTLAVEYSIPLPNYVHGVSVDYNGYVWGVTQFGTDAYRVDPMAGTWDVVSGLVGPYTYSDMTGFALNNVGGGGAPSG